MNMRARQLWAPVLSTFLVSVSVRFVALRVIGALGAWLSLRGGGNIRDRLLTALGSAWLIGSILTLGVPLSMVIERHFSLRIKLADIVYMIAWCLIPAVLLARGPALAGTQGHNARAGRHRPRATRSSRSRVCV